MGRIVCWFGSKDTRDSHLAFPDIAVVSQDSSRVLVLIEIEESSAPPKKLMADALTTLIGDHITFQGRRELKVGLWTRIVVLAKADKVAMGIPRLKLLQERLNEIRGQLRSGNASVQQVVIGTFQDQTNLKAKLFREIEKALVSNV